MEEPGSIEPQIPWGALGASAVQISFDTVNRELAVKVFQAVRTVEELREAAVREFETLLTVRHANISHIYNTFELQSAFFIITERCFDSLEGCSGSKGLMECSGLCPSPAASFRRCIPAIPLGWRTRTYT
jgi:hypothetical protein